MSALTLTSEEIAMMAAAIAGQDGAARIIRLARGEFEGSPNRLRMVSMLRGDRFACAKLGVRIVYENGKEIAAFGRNHPYLNQIMQDADEPARAWEKALRRLPGVHGRATEAGRALATPLGYLWAALLSIEW